jgi:hypothetical protein
MKRLAVCRSSTPSSRKQRRRVVTAATMRYREAMRGFAGMSDLDVWYARADVDLVREVFGPQLTKRSRKNMEKYLAKARTRDSMQAFSKWCGVVEGKMRIIADPPLIMPVSHLLPEERDRLALEAQLDGLIAQYRRSLSGDHRVLFGRYHLADVAHKVVGVGSVGTRCWICLFTGREDTDPLLLQVKEAQPSVLAAYTAASRYANQGQRVVQGQRLMQAASDIFLGWQRTTQDIFDGKTYDYYIRQLRDWKYSLDIDDIDPARMQTYGQLCAWTLARAHARSGDPVAITAYLGGSDVFDQAITEFAAAYANQNERDHQALAAAAATGRITAQSGL